MLISICSLYVDTFQMSRRSLALDQTKFNFVTQLYSYQSIKNIHVCHVAI
jgi:hypothetical protein